MKYTFSLVEEWLSAALQTPPVLCRIPEGTEVKGVSDRLPGQTRKDWIYVLSTENLASWTGTPLSRMILLAEKDEAAADRIPDIPDGSAAAVFRTGKSKTEVLELIQDCFASYNEWYDNLLQAIREGSSWFAVVREGHKQLRNPIILYDRSMKVLAFTKDDGTDDNVWKDTVSSGTARVETSSEADELLKYVSRLDRSAKPFRHIGEGMSDPFYSCNVMVRGKRCGMVTVIEYHAPLTQGQLELLQIFADTIAVRFQDNEEQRMTQVALNDRLLHDLIAGRVKSQERLNTRMIASGWKPGSFFRLLRFTSRLSFLNEMQWTQNLEDLYRGGLNGIGSVIHREQTAICFLCTSGEEELKQGTEELLRRYCAAHHMRCGISSAYRDLLETPRHDMQAEAALELGEGDIVPYEKVRFSRMIRHLKAAEYTEDLIHPAVLQLQRLDRETGTEYVKTLRCLLENGLRQTDAARALKIHRTTLIYRMRRIHELTNLDMEDAGDVIHAAISIRMTE